MRKCKCTPQMNLGPPVGSMNVESKLETELLALTEEKTMHKVSEVVKMCGFGHMKQRVTTLYIQLILPYNNGDMRILLTIYFHTFNFFVPSFHFLSNSNF